jgi:hypothetical protein
VIALVHLVWAPLGVQPLRTFLSCYRAHPAGAEHRLVILLNGAGAGGPTPSERERLLAELDGVEHRLIEPERPLLDLPAYAYAARALEDDVLCLLGSYCEPLADRWLGMLVDALAQPDVGLAGASGSWESQSDWRRGSLAQRGLQLATLARSRRDYPRFPNPHVRTGAFAIARTRLLDAGMSAASTKRATYVLESGHASITRRVQAQGLRAVVVGRDGDAYDVERWPDSRTYRSGGQQNLLIADNRTREWARCSPRRKRRLAHDAWGERALL